MSRPALNVTLRARVWVEIQCLILPIAHSQLSPSVRGWGLKYRVIEHFPNDIGSPSVRGCGLKLNSAVDLAKVVAVTLRARVWVEIQNLTPFIILCFCHPPCEGVG